MVARTWPIVLLAALLLAGAVVAAQGTAPGLPYDLSWWTADAGGGLSAAPSGANTLHGTIGQPDAGHATSPAYTLSGGFWARAIPYRVYLPLVSKSAP